GISIQWQSATVSGGPYTNIPGATGANYNFTAAGGTTYYVAIVTCSNGGASATTAQHTLVVGAPVHSAVSATVTTACSPGAATVTGTVSGGVLPSLTVLGTSGTINLGIPDNTPAGINTTIVLPASTITNAADLRVRITANHSWVGDLKFTLTSPCGTTFLFDRPGVPATTVGNLANLGTSNATTPPPAVYTFDLSAATVIPETAPPAGFIPAGNYLPSNTAGASHNWTGLTFPCSAAGNWQLNISDNAVGDLGTLASWQILAPAVYTHTLTGPGTITQNPATGPNNSIANFTVTNLPAGLNAFTLTSTDGIGCSVATNVAAAVTQTPVVTIVPPAPVICAGAIQQLTATAAAISTQTFASGAINLAFPDNTPAGVTTPAIVVPAGINFAAASNLRILINARHSWVGDLVFRVNSPCGTTFLFDRPGVPATTVGNLANLGTSNATTPPPAVYIFDLSAATVIPETAPPAGFIPAGNYLPSNTAGTSHNWTGLTFPCAGTGNWTLTISDNAVGDLGALVDWAILYDPPAPPVTWTPVTNVYTDPLATIPYVAGTPMSTIWVKPPITTVYTASATNGACTGTANVTVTVNQLPAITAQPVALAAPVCPGFNVTYTVGATGTGLSYQWQVSTDNGVTYSNIINNPPYTGATTASLLITNVTTAMNGYRYRVIVSGTCPPAVTSNPVTLVVSTPPTITTQPVNRIVCVNQTTTFSVVAAGVPAPTIYQWQVSTDNGVTFTNLTTNGSYTATYTIPPALITMNNYRYRVIITNTCGQTITSSVVTLTVNALPVVTAAALASRICISDTLIPLSGSPVGGSWSGIGVSGFNFVPSSTAVGTYTLTYTYTNAAGCTATASVVAKVEDCQERLRLLSDDGVILYPNPNNGRFNIRINSTLYNYLGMKVYNAQGQLLNGQAMNSILVSPVYTGLVYGRVIPIDLSKLPAGIYMVKFYYDDGVRTSEKAFKVIIGAH
ncbi:MAG TPA: T9SS type A sorting domain-containing protein, partial [Chitinophagaceae bacterium]|nr:T9SS type A sorting domain-containing protein [Chitinophagaceae bacterium]